MKLPPILTGHATALLALALLPTAALAQQGQGQNNNVTPGTAGVENGLKGFWECVTPTGRFVVRLDQISSVSQHVYIIDGGARVYEVTVSTTGPMVARYYFIEPITAGSNLSLGQATVERLRGVANKAGGRVGIDTERDVVKTPNTTHAKTAEYRLVVKENLDRIYNHVHKVWAEERGRGEKNKITIRDN